ncbi:hypothetical protein [Nannocystis bainbridge]|uniref:Lipoprotein n=1 Tax=Nannocystis bainbridge TaxID=2995303 RepID=A0ABT5EAW8_9BACT|nr:hypothetical protein [Nannocystis bainbridge]MDC0722012.1 hypothetical protein [Nannocystis bainbridge]
MTRNFLVYAVSACLAGLFGFACKSGGGGGGSHAPGTVTAIEGSSSCPRSVPARGASCPRGESEFCVYRTTGGDFACVCGGGKWGCGSK